MQITVVALMCHMLAPISEPVCHEEMIVSSEELSFMGCQLGMPAWADWKMHSRFSGDDWKIARVRCIVGKYVKRDAI